MYLNKIATFVLHVSPCMYIKIKNIKFFHYYFISFAALHPLHIHIYLWNYPRQISEICFIASTLPPLRPHHRDIHRFVSAIALCAIVVYDASRPPLPHLQHHRLT